MNLWYQLPVWLHDLLLLVALLAPVIVLTAVLTHGFRPWPLVRSLLWRFRWANLSFVLLIALSTAMGVALSSQERALRQGTAQAADKFDLIVAAPGSEISLLMAAVYLQPTQLNLLDADTFKRISLHPQVKFAAPLAFGDSYQGSPVVGTTADFVRHLTESQITGELWQTPFEVLVGDKVALAVGTRFRPSHGVGHGVDGSHDDHELRVVGRMASTGTPWDNAILMPIEGVWLIHDLPFGHAPGSDYRLGEHFDFDHFPGTSVVLVSAEQLWANYALRTEFNTATSLAFFPGTVLAELYRLMGDVHYWVSLMSRITQFLVGGSVMLSLFIIVRLFSRQMALLRALGAPDRFVISVLWGYAAGLILLGVLLGAAMGWVATQLVSGYLSAVMDINLRASLGFAEAHLLAVFLSVSLLVSFFPGWAVVKRPILSSLSR